MYEKLNIGGEILALPSAQRIDGILYQFTAIASRVLVVAVINEDAGDWSAYVDAVAGQRHEKEFKRVAESGSKLPFEVARFYFPTIAAHFRWRS